MTITEKITDWTQRINQTTEDFQTQFGGLTAMQLNWKPDASVWSIGQNIDHLIKINSSYFPVLEQLKNSTIKLPFTARLGFMNNFLGRFILKSVRPETRKKIKTLSIWEPITGNITPSILKEFKENQKSLIQKIEENKSFLNAKAIIYSPANKRITYSLEKAFEIMAVHERRHLQQALEVLNLMKKSNPNILTKKQLLMPTPAFDIHVNRKNFYQHKIVEKEAPTENDLADGQILVKVDKFAFTSNNITYAAVGEVVGYWKFFPVSDDFGIIPVWGFANVIASKNESIKEGERFYGYYPMGSHLIMSPTKVKQTNFTDGIGHRVALPPIYNNYVNTKTDPSYSSEGEAIQSLFRPLFTTSFLLDDFLDDNNFFGGKNIILTSASSKTAIGLAFLLAQRQGSQTINIVGLTSTGNKDFVKGLGYYDQVLTYDEFSQLADNEASVIVDFSGSAQSQENLQNHLGENLSYNCLVGMVDWTQRGGANSAATKGSFFFAPSQAIKRNKEWGVAGFQQKLGMAWLAFIGQIGDWMAVQTTKGSTGLSDLYLPMLDGKIDPKIGHIVVLN